MNARSETQIDDCPSWSRLFWAAEEGGGQLQEHLRSCPRCRQRYDLVKNRGPMSPLAVSQGHSGDCPGIEEWLGLADGVIAGARRLALTEHLASCDTCACAWRYIVGVGDGEETQWELRDAPPPSLGPTTGPAREPRFSHSFARAAAAVVLLGLLIAVALNPLPPVDVGGEQRWRGPAPSLSSSSDWRIGDPGPTLRWDEWAGASSYRLRVWDREGNSVLERTVGSETVSFLLRLDQPRERSVLLWSVEATSDGIVVAAAPPRTLIWEAR